MLRRNSTQRRKRELIIPVLACVWSLLLAGCLEQYQTTRIPEGSVANFVLHLQAGELNDARAYMAPGLVTPSAELDASIKSASDKLRRYEIEDKQTTGKDLGNGERIETVTGRIRPRVPAGQPTPAPGAGWTDATILTARVVERGPGWRILEFELKCCAN